MSQDPASPRKATRSLVRRALDRAALRMRALLNINETLRFDDVEIALSPGHSLPHHQKFRPLYDRFLPHLGCYLEPDSWVVDVGANCGDTLAALFTQNPGLRFVAIEPDPLFFSLLEKNAALLSTRERPLRAHLIQSLVGEQIASASLVGSGGTKRAVPSFGHQSSASRTLDEILTHCAVGTVRLLKSDVDGYDYDVLNSSWSTISRDLPIIFFECQTDLASQKEGFDQLVNRLYQAGYHYWVMFDNFGNVVFRTSDCDDVIQLIDYVWRTSLIDTWRTIYYFDVLAASDKDREVTKEAVDDFLRGKS